jgi:HD-GYP domain-containing protein (c-di-GMP phosphodiesterase class II)
VAKAESVEAQWGSKPRLAFLVRFLVFAAPIVVGVLVTSAAAAIIFSTDWPNGIRAVWIVFLGMLGAVTGQYVSNLTRKVLPLAALLQLTLVFPDAAPSRMALALRAGNVAKGDALVEQFRTYGLSEDPQTACEEVLALINALHNHDRRTRGHSERVRAWSEVIGVELGLSIDECHRLRWGALLHDIGKLAVPSPVLNKVHRLTDVERAVISSHPLEGERRIQPLRKWLGEWSRAVGDHHERWDGNGYPRGLKGDEISLAGRIVAVADSFEVMTATRSYKKPQGLGAARAELVRCSGSHFDPEVVRAVLNASEARNVGWIGGLVSSLKAIAEPATAFSGTAVTMAAAIMLGVSSTAPDAPAPLPSPSRQSPKVLALRPAPTTKATTSVVTTVVTTSVPITSVPITSVPSVVSSVVSTTEGTIAAVAAPLRLPTTSTAIATTSTIATSPPTTTATTSVPTTVAAVTVPLPVEVPPAPPVEIAPPRSPAAPSPSPSPSPRSAAPSKSHAKHGRGIPRSWHVSDPVPGGVNYPATGESSSWGEPEPDQPVQEPLVPSSSASSSSSSSSLSSTTSVSTGIVSTTSVSTGSVATGIVSTPPTVPVPSPLAASNGVTSSIASIPATGGPSTSVLPQ